MQGTVLDFDAVNDQGLILGDDGKRYIFTSHDWQDKTAFPQARLTVDFVVEEQKALSIYCISTKNDQSFNSTDFLDEVSNKNFFLTQVLGLAGSIIMFLGVFAPVISIPVMGSLNYFQNGKGDGVFIIIFALASFVLILLKMYRLLWFTGLGSLLILTYTFINLHMSGIADEGSKSVLSEHKYYSIAKDCYLGKHSGV